MSRYIELEHTKYLHMPFSNCKYCGFDNPCIWMLKRNDLIKYYIDCSERNKGFGELGCVESTNRGARKVMYQKLNGLLGWHGNKPTPTCCVNGLSFLFPSTAFQDGTQLPDFLSEGERAMKRQRQTTLRADMAEIPTGDTDTE